MPPTFKDQTDREWAVRITVGTVRRIKEQLGYDLLRIEEGDPPLATKLAADPIVVCEVMHAVLLPELQAEGVSLDAFCERMGGAQMAAAYAAFTEAIIDFFRQLGRDDLAQVMQTSTTLARKEIEKREMGYGRAELKLEQELDKVTPALLDQRMDQAIAERNLTLGNTSGASPESSESTPIHLPSAS